MPHIETLLKDDEGDNSFVRKIKAAAGKYLDKNKGDGWFSSRVANMRHGEGLQLANKLIEANDATMISETLSDIARKQCPTLSEFILKELNYKVLRDEVNKTATLTVIINNNEQYSTTFSPPTQTTGAGHAVTVVMDTNSVVLLKELLNGVHPIDQENQEMREIQTTARRPR